MDRVLSPQEYQEKGEGTQERGRRRREAAQAHATSTGDAAAAAFLASFDTDGNGSVSKAEFRGPEGSFLRLDLDGDGGISLTEAPQDGIPEVGSMDIYTEWVGLHDTDKDENVEPGELPGGDNRFEGLDLNKDGELARDELRHLEAHVPESFGLEQDTNQDGQISAREFQGNEATFLNLDVDRDGQISWKRAD